VSLTIDLGARRLHGSIFFPRWVVQHPERTVCFQNDHLEQMRRYRDQGPTYPIEVVNKFARIHFMETCRSDDESVISVPPSQLPRGYLEREN
jgi:phenolic acid decarboxylase